MAKKYRYDKQKRVLGLVNRLLEHGEQGAVSGIVRDILHDPPRKPRGRPRGVTRQGVHKPNTDAHERAADLVREKRAAWLAQNPDRQRLPRGKLVRLIDEALSVVRARTGTDRLSADYVRTLLKR